MMAHTCHRFKSVGAGLGGSSTAYAVVVAPFGATTLHDAVRTCKGDGLNHDPPLNASDHVQVVVDPKSNRLQLLAPFSQWDGGDIVDAQVCLHPRWDAPSSAPSVAG